MLCSHTLAVCSESNYSTAWSKRITGRHLKTSSLLLSCVFSRIWTAWHSRDFGMVCPMLYKTFKQDGMLIITCLRRKKRCLTRRPPCCAFPTLRAKRSYQSTVACRQESTGTCQKRTCDSHTVSAVKFSFIYLKKLKWACTQSKFRWGNKRKDKFVTLRAKHTTSLVAC